MYHGKHVSNVKSHCGYCSVCSLNHLNNMLLFSLCSRLHIMDTTIDWHLEELFFAIRVTLH